MSDCGRPRAITPEVEERLFRGLGVGAPIHIACEFAGISHETFHDEIRRNPDFADRVHRTRGDVIVTAMGFIQVAGASDWRAADRLTQIARPEHFGKGREVGGGEGLPPDLPIDDISPEEAAAVVAAIRAVRAVRGGGEGAAADEEAAAEPVREDEADDPPADLPGDGGG